MNVLRGLVTRQTKMVLIVRADLKLTKGKTGSQCAHAAVICLLKAQTEKSAICSAWLGQGQPKIVLKVDTLQELQDLQKLAAKEDVIFGEVRDAGRTQIPAGTVTVLGVGPDVVDKIDGLVKHLKLL